MTKKLEDIKPDGENPRIMTESSRDALGFSIEEFGDISGITLNERTGELATGHQRWGELVKRGENPAIKEVKKYKFRGEEEKLCTVFSEKAGLFTIRVVNWTKEKQQAANIAANSRFLSGDYTQEAIGLLKEAEAAFPDVYEPLRFNDLLEELERQFEGLNEPPPGGGLTDPEQIPESPETRSRAGDIWALDEHRILCGDAMGPGALLRILGANKIRVVWTDPPYGVAYADKNEFLNAAGKGNSNQEEIEGDHMSPEEVEALISKALNSISPNIVAGASFYIAAPAGDMLPLFLSAIKTSGVFNYKHGLVWIKNNFVLGRCDYHYRHEMVLYGWNGAAGHYFVNDHTKSTVFEFDKPRDSDAHPTMKPVALILEHIQNSSQPGEVVYDPFIGSGSTLIAAERIGRICYGVDIDPANVDIAVQRWEDFTGKAAKKI